MYIYIYIYIYVISNNCEHGTFCMNHLHKYKFMYEILGFLLMMTQHWWIFNDVILCTDAANEKCRLWPEKMSPDQGRPSIVLFTPIKLQI